MAVLKCKMCGGELNIQDGMTVAECEYCGTKQTVPTADNEKKMTLFARANRLRAACEFDKAAGVYESIVVEFPEEAEAYWGLLLCKYGIEYVDDPATGKKIPTCHRSSFDSIMDDSDFEMVMENSDAIARRVYREEAKTIEDIRKGIIEVSSKEEPYDIFICYKETDENGERTIDSVIAQDIYKALTDEGYRVFFARISLEDKLGTAYEPYIFAALNSAKVMLAIGTDYDYYNAVWVKNEWSRFLALIAKGEKKTLIPCYKDIDAYDIPREFKHLQAQDMGKVGAMQDLLRGIGKLLPKKKQETASQTVAVNSVTNEIQPLLKRASMSLEDGEWDKAIDFCNMVLNIDAEKGEAYLCIAMAKTKCNNKETFANKFIQGALGVDISKELRRAGLFSPEIKEWLTELDIKKEEDNERKRAEEIEAKYVDACALQKIGNVKCLETAVLKFSALGDYKDSAERAKECLNVYDEIIAHKKAELEARRAYTKTFRNIIICEGDLTVGIKENGSLIVVGDNKHGQCSISSWTGISTIVMESSHIIGLKNDGTVVSYGPFDPYYKDERSDLGQCNVYNWKNIVAVVTRFHHTVGLKSDGTVVATKITGVMESVFNFGQCDVSGWEDIVAISAGTRHTVGLKSDGTVVATKFTRNQELYCGQCDVSDWTDIVEISAGAFYTVGLKKDGTVVATKVTDSDVDYGQSAVEGWTNIIEISTSSFYTVGLRSDGKVFAVGKNDYGQCDVSNWEDIVAISAGRFHTVGLKSDGTVVAVGKNDHGQCNVQDWTDIVAIATGSFHTVGLKSDGTLVAVGYNNDGQCDVSDWKLFRTSDEKEIDYIKAFELKESGQERELSSAAEIFYGLKDYKDSSELAEMCTQSLEEKKTEREQAERAAAQEAEKKRREEERQRKIVALNGEKSSLQTELANLKGLFTGKRRKEIETRLAQIDSELQKLK